MNNEIVITKEMAEKFTELLLQPSPSEQEFVLRNEMLHRVNIETNREPRVAIWWDLEDIRNQAHNNDMKISDAHALEILNALPMEHDATIGINWEVIDDLLLGLKAEMELLHGDNYWEEKQNGAKSE